ncbi:MAG TPA: biopolymer transporter ExbD [Kofleriaceae bacterium]|nr:biopolymer transporter ExbD [Kofleriaceae bacterium]
MAIGKLPDADDSEEASEGIFAEINITPLTDVFLVMVIIFMVSALAEVDQTRKQQQQHQQQDQQQEIEKRSGIKVTLPSGKAQEIDPTKASLVLMVPINGDVMVAGKTVSDADIDKLFRAAFTRDKLTQVVLKADKGVQHGRVVNLMERAKQAGLTRLAIGTSAGG